MSDLKWIDEAGYIKAKTSYEQIMKLIEEKLLYLPDQRLFLATSPSQLGSPNHWYFQNKEYNVSNNTLKLEDLGDLYKQVSLSENYGFHICNKGLGIATLKNVKLTQNNENLDEEDVTF